MDDDPATDDLIEDWIESYQRTWELIKENITLNFDARPFITEKEDGTMELDRIGWMNHIIEELEKKKESGENRPP